MGGGKGYAEAAYVHRSTGSLIEDFITTENGFTHITAAGIDAGLATNHVYMNTDLADRVFDGMVFQSRYQLSRAGRRTASSRCSCGTTATTPVKGSTRRARRHASATIPKRIRRRSTIRKGGCRTSSADAFARGASTTSASAALGELSDVGTVAL